MHMLYLLRKTLSLSTVFRPSSTLSSYERILSTPAFSVTTSWGSPYMIFERLSRAEDLAEEEAENIFGSNTDLDKELEPLSDTITEGDDEEKQQRTRTTALYFLDPDDASALSDEMKQMGGGMSSADIRVMSSSFGKALRQSSIISSSSGLPTGQPLDDTTGRLRGDAGMTLRYKLVPSKRELFYACRCKGKESVGLFSDSGEDVKEIITGKRQKRRLGTQEMRGSIEKRKKQLSSETNPMRSKYAHMSGKTGIPLFYIHGMELISRKQKQIPLFFSYEDSIQSWRKINPNKSMPKVEVFNFVDVIVSMDKNQQEALQKRNPKWNFWNKSQPKDDTNPDLIQLQNILFVPSSKSLNFKHRTTRLGNRKARLRPMREKLGLGL